MLEPHKILENLYYTNNCCKAISSKIEHCQDKLAEESAKEPQNVDAIVRLSAKYAALREEQRLAFERRTIAREELNELFASMRG